MSTVLVPKSGASGHDIAAAVEAAGLFAVSLPLTTQQAATETEALDRALEQLSNGRFDWLVVTSQATANYLGYVPQSVRIAAVGDVTAAVLRAKGLPVAFVPKVQSAAGLVDEWPVREGRVLWPHSGSARQTIRTGLSGLGMDVTGVVAYDSVPMFDGAADLTAALAAQGAERVDVLLVTSGSVAREVARLSLATSAEVRIVAIGAQTAEDCARHGVRVDAIAKSPTPEGLALAAQQVAGATA